MGVLTSNPHNPPPSTCIQHLLLRDVMLLLTPTSHSGLVFAAGLKTARSGSFRKPDRRGYCSTCSTPKR